MITPIEIQSKTFKSGGLGYDKKDVDSFMRDVLRSYEQIYRENMELTDKVAVLSEGIQYYKTIEKTLQKALVLAEKTAEDTKSAALEKAKAIEKEAKTRSQLIVADAKNELEHIHNQTIQLIQQYERYKCQFKNLAKAQMELIESDCFNINIARLDALIDTNPTVNERRSQQVRTKQVQEHTPRNRQIQEQATRSNQMEEQATRTRQIQEQSKSAQKQARLVEDNIPETYFDALEQVSATQEMDQAYTTVKKQQSEKNQQFAKQQYESDETQDYPYDQKFEAEDYPYDEEEESVTNYDRKDEIENQDEFSFINLVDEED